MGIRVVMLFLSPSAVSTVSAIAHTDGTASACRDGGPFFKPSRRSRDVNRKRNTKHHEVVEKEQKQTTIGNVEEEMCFVAGICSPRIQRRRGRKTAPFPFSSTTHTERQASQNCFRRIAELFI